MSVIDTLIEPDRVTRVFFDCRHGETVAADEARIAQAIARARAADAREQRRQAA